MHKARSRFYWLSNGIKILQEKGRLNEVLLLGVFTLICFALSIFRFLVSDTKVFLFLNWNLFLAFIPWAMASLIWLVPRFQESKFSSFILLGVWLLFFPNAPYILTDLFHLRIKSSVPLWFDLVLILSFAWTGLLFGFLSLWDIELALEKKTGVFWSKVLSVGLLFLGAFGIYLGRYLRWNSWDIVSEPFRLIYDIGDRVINPFEHLRTWGVTLFMGLLLNMIYWSFRFIRQRGMNDSS